MSDGADFDIGDDLISAYDVGGLVSVVDGERIFEGNRGDFVAADEGPINTIDHGPGIYDGGGCDNVQCYWGDDDRDWNVQGLFPAV